MILAMYIHDDDMRYDEMSYEHHDSHDDWQMNGSDFGRQESLCGSGIDMPMRTQCERRSCCSTVANNDMVLFRSASSSAVSSLHRLHCCYSSCSHFSSSRIIRCIAANAVLAFILPPPTSSLEATCCAASAAPVVQPNVHSFHHDEAGADTHALISDALSHSPS